jgi:hypothetical protein
MPRYEINFDFAISSGPFKGLFLLEKFVCRNGEMNIAGVTIAGASIGSKPIRKQSDYPARLSGLLGH